MCIAIESAHSMNIAPLPSQNSGYFFFGGGGGDTFESGEAKETLFQSTRVVLQPSLRGKPWWYLVI